MELQTVIRNAKIADSDVAAELVRQLGYPTDREDARNRLERLLERPDHLMAMAERGGRVVGLICACWGLHIERGGRCGRVTALVVADGHRGEGIGALLLAHAESWLRAQGATSCLVNSQPRRTDAHRFYEREGYRVTGLRFFKEW